MSIKDEILRIKSNISNAYSKLEEKGATLPTDKNSSNLASTIDSLVLSSSNVATDIINGTITTVDQEALGQVESIRSGAFDGLNIETVDIPSNVAVVGNSAFANNNITSLSLGEGVTTIGDSAFQNNSITNVTIPASVTTIGDSAFAGNVLTEITMESDTPPVVTATTFPDTLQTTNVSYNGYPNYSDDPNWQTYKDTLVRGLAIPSTITVTVNNYLGEMVSGASVTITGNEQTYTGTTDSVGVFSQGNLQPATYTISVADLEGFKTPVSQEVVVEEDTRNSVIVTYLEKPAFEFSRTFSENTPAQISAVSAEISANNMTSAQVAETYGWNIGDTTTIPLSTGENIEMQIIGINHDDKSDGTGKAGITLQMKNCLSTLYPMCASSSEYWYKNCSMRNVTLPTIKTTLPQEWQDIIVNVDKMLHVRNSGTKFEVYSLDLFLLAEIEIAGTQINSYGGSNEGSVYEYWSGQPTTPSDYRIKKYDANSDGILDTNTSWWLRSERTGWVEEQFVMIRYDGAYSYTSELNSLGVSFAFCV